MLIKPLDTAEIRFASCVPFLFNLHFLLTHSRPSDKAGEIHLCSMSLVSLVISLLLLSFSPHYLPSRLYRHKTHTLFQC